jgi:putative ABC transport system permease protein
MCLYGLPRLFIRGLVVFAMLTTLGVAGGLGCSAENKAPTRDEEYRDFHARNVAVYGENSIIIYPGTGWGQVDSAKLTIQDVQAITKRCPAVIAVAPIMRVFGEVSSNSKSWVPAYIYGTAEQYLVVRDWTKLKVVKLFSEEDINDAKAVCLLGQTVTESLFGGASPLGQEIKIKGNSFRVVGVLAEKGCNSMNLDQDDVILMPWTTTSKLFDATNQGKLGLIYAKAASSEKMPAAMQEIKEVLREEHHIKKSGPDDFKVVDLIKSQEELIIKVHEAEQGGKGK